MLKFIVTFLVATTSLFSQNYQFHDKGDNGQIYKAYLIGDYIYASTYYEVYNEETRTSKDYYFIVRYDKDFNQEVVIDSDEMAVNGQELVGFFFEWNGKIMLPNMYYIEGNKLIQPPLADLEGRDGRGYGGMIINKKGNLIVTAGSVVIIRRDTINTQVITYQDSYYEIFEVDPDFNYKKLIEGYTTTEGGKYDKFEGIVQDDNGNIWTAYMQGASGKGGLLKISDDGSIEEFDLQTYSNRAFRATPTSMSLINDKIYLPILSGKVNNYQGGISIYESKNNSWETLFDFTESAPDLGPEGTQMYLVTEIIKIDSKLFLLTNGRGIFVEEEGEYSYINFKEGYDFGVKFPYQLGVKNVFEFGDNLVFVTSIGFITTQLSTQ